MASSLGPFQKNAIYDLPRIQLPAFGFVFILTYKKMSDNKGSKPVCKYGPKCYRKNPAHFEEFTHDQSRRTSPEQTQARSPSPGRTSLNEENSAKNNASASNKKRNLEDTTTETDNNGGSDSRTQKKQKRSSDSSIEPPVTMPDASPSDSGEPDLPKTVVTFPSDPNGLHLGYWRDDPAELPVFVASNRSKCGGVCKNEGRNLFHALYSVLTEKLKTCDPFSKVPLKKAIDLLSSRAEKGASLEDLYQASSSASKRKPLARPFHGLGMVVPYDKKHDIGYRPLPESNRSLKRILERVATAATDVARDEALDSLQELVTNVQFANDEGDPGMGLELGQDIFSFDRSGPVFNSIIKHLLEVAYDLLNRKPFATILEVHLDRRGDNPCR
ncbi:unnamed protein product [Cyprideis torosa]|uniref:PBZ-type domain-containing protein n=1 Tax=Cyprideis torosa TaxID=163714 RepID=A0A7R8WFY6_9CRUS|nr:unnamed protein product [Cyprideis torosa]CAG0891483.1 unnamed protein product [Cyprideis torosa]